MFPTIHSLILGKFDHIVAGRRPFIKNNNDNNNTIIVSCAGDNELAKAVYTFLKAEFPTMNSSLVEDEVYLFLLDSDHQLMNTSPSLSSQISAALEKLVSSVASFEKCTINCFKCEGGKNVFVHS